MIIDHTLTASFFWNWCNATPKWITKSNRLWLRGSILLILKPFLGVFFSLIKGHPYPQPKKREWIKYRKSGLPIEQFLYPTQSGLPIARVSCPNVENSENQENLDYRLSDRKVRSKFLAKLFPSRDVHQWEILAQWSDKISERATPFLMAKNNPNVDSYKLRLLLQKCFFPILSDERVLSKF